MADKLDRVPIQETEERQAYAKSSAADVESVCRCREQSASELVAPIPALHESASLRWRCWQTERISGKLKGSAVFAE